MTETTRITLTGSELPIDGARQIGALPHDQAIDVRLPLKQGSCPIPRRVACPCVPRPDACVAMPERICRH